MHNFSSVCALVLPMCACLEGHARIVCLLLPTRCCSILQQSSRIDLAEQSQGVQQGQRKASTLEMVPRRPQQPLQGTQTYLWTPTALSAFSTSHA